MCLCDVSVWCVSVMCLCDVSQSWAYSSLSCVCVMCLRETCVWGRCIQLLLVSVMCLCTVFERHISLRRWYISWSRNPPLPGGLFSGCFDLKIREEEIPTKRQITKFNWKIVKERSNHPKRWPPRGWRVYYRVAKTHRMQVIFRNRATNYRALLQKMTYEDKPCILFAKNLQGGEDAQDDLSCWSFSANSPWIIGLFCEKWPINRMRLCNPVPSISWLSRGLSS